MPRRCGLGVGDSDGGACRSTSALHGQAERQTHSAAACPTGLLLQLARHDRLSAFLKTRAGRPVYWHPKQHSHVTLALQDAQRQELQAWKVR